MISSCRAELKIERNRAQLLFNFIHTIKYYFVSFLLSLLIRSSEEGYAIKLEWENLNEELLYESIQKLLNQPRY
jgi:hypothetical protein